MKNSITFLTFGILWCSGFSQTSEAAATALTQALTIIEQQGNINGFSVAIVNADSIMYSKGFGYADIYLKKEYTKNTLQPIASISKTVIGLSLLKAQELGKLKLDDPINDYLPFSVINPYYPENPITIRQLASHTSTIKDAKQYDTKGYVLINENNDGTIVSEDFLTSNKMMDYGVFLQKILSRKGTWYKKKNFLKTKPGALFEYSNLGAGLAALVLEKAVGEPFPSFTKTHIFEPLGMNNTAWSLNGVDNSKLTKLYVDENKELASYQLVNYPDGGLITSAHDLGTYLSELISGYNGNGIILNTTNYIELFTPNLSDENHKDRSDSTYSDEYNMGIFMGMSSKGQIGHTGGDPAVTTLMFFNTETKTGKLVLVNTELNRAGITGLKDIFRTLESYETKL